MTDTSSRLPLSVLDFAPVASGASAAQALRDTVRIAQSVDRLGYLRYWMAEHHNAPNIASCSPPLMIGRIAAATSRLRVGSGGVMLPNHAPLVVAEQFGTLEALHPDRIDLGIGRASGTDPITARALRRSSDPGDDFPQRFAELLDYFESPAHGGPISPVSAIPAEGNRPPIWMLGSSPSSARMAGMLGLPFAFAHHFSAENTIPALATYRENFRPSADLDHPYAIVAAIVIVAETQERAEWLAGPMGLSSLLQRTSGITGPYPSPEYAEAFEYSREEREFVRQRIAAHLVGGRHDIAAKIDAFVDRTGADELMALTLVHGVDDRIRSFEILAEATGLVPSAHSADSLTR
ncbi:LLM class flavin-dependent oxidoreductase [Embleya sp. NPDC050154]|uniref:LLM class flavin-dependent oxidoreductase n=1 Tax=unclassified Embleya TaxID=2699296 RepID=UPI0037B22014|nr:LLM class flavin-dependent oxidoreductase [Embleya sp. NBC_00888]